MSAGFDNTVIVIGGDHHNTLAVVRCLGKQKCNQKLLIHTSKTDVRQLCISHSKYALQKTECIAETEEAIVQWLLEHATEQKQILFPCSDFAAYTIDAHYQQLAPWFVMPGFKGCPGKVVELMDKGRQSEFALEHGLPMAKTWKITKDCVEIPKDMYYPCIVKPAVSAFGSKSDIIICENAKDLEGSLQRLTADGYETLIVQQFLHKLYEACAYGCLVDRREDCAGAVIRKIREVPGRGGGSTIFAQFIADTDIESQKEAIINILYNAGYRGQYDIEFLVCTDGVYLNEINFRHSGNGYALVQNGVHAPYIWCCDAIGIVKDNDNKAKASVKIGTYHMEELYDLYYCKKNHLSLFVWLRDCLRTKAFARFDWRDIRGTWAFWRPFARKAFYKLFGK